MKKTKLILLTILIAIFMTTPMAFARDDRNGHDGHDKQEMSGKHHEMMRKHQEMKRETMEMLKKTMTIIKNLNHKPSATDKKKLSEMIEKLDGMISSCDKKAEKMKRGHSEHGSENHDHDRDHDNN
ncbi:MAG: hypothetical protein V3T30_00295 [Thermodesulfobacteriota bacterium]